MHPLEDTTQSTIIQQKKKKKKKKFNENSSNRADAGECCNNVHLEKEAIVVVCATIKYTVKLEQKILLIGLSQFENLMTN